MLLKRLFLRLQSYSSSQKRFVSREHLNFLKEVKKETNPRPAEFNRQAPKEIGVAGYLLLAVPLTTTGLGIWQVQRKQWKEELIRNLEAKLKIPPVPFPEDLDELDRMEYHTVVVRGKFLHEREMLMGPRSLITPDGGEQGGGLITTQQDNIGYLVITPFKLENRNEIILINRGFISSKQKAKQEKTGDGYPKDTVELKGIVRHQEKRPQFTPDHKGNMFFYRDLIKMAKMSGSLPVFLDACADSTVPGGPIAGQTRVTIRNEHTSYIITWFSLTTFTSWMWYSRIFKRAVLK